MRGDGGERARQGVVEGGRRLALRSPRAVRARARVSAAGSRSAHSAGRSVAVVASGAGAVASSSSGREGSSGRARAARTRARRPRGDRGRARGEDRPHPPPHRPRTIPDASPRAWRSATMSPRDSRLYDESQSASPERVVVRESRHATRQSPARGARWRRGRRRASTPTAATTIRVEGGTATATRSFTLPSRASAARAPPASNPSREVPPRASS